MSRSIALPLIPALLASLALLLAGCAAQPAPALPDQEILQDQPPSATFYKDGQLLLQYGSIYLGATWPATDQTDRQFRYYATSIDLVADATPDLQTLQRDWQPVTLLGNDRWNSIVRSLLESAAPEKPDNGTLITLQGADFVISRGPDGALAVHRLERKPASLKITRSIGEEAFSALANASLKDELARDGQLPGPVMFVVGEKEPGRAFVLFDLAADRSIFLTHPAGALPLGKKLGYSLRLLDALVLRSQVLGMVRNPVSSTNRLLWMTGHSGAVLLPRGLALGKQAPPPLAHNAPMDPAAWEALLDDLINPEKYRASLKPLIDGEAFFVELIQAIQDAREAIDLQIYIFDSDDYALRIADLLKQRSRDIKVRVLVDRLGSLAAGQVPSKSPYYSSSKPPLSILGYLRENSAIEVRALENPWLTSSHTKLIVIDHAKAYIGGMNIGREYRYEWHDLMLEVGGPLVRRLQKDFDGRWTHAGPGGDLAFAFNAGRPDEPGDPGTAGQAEVRPLYTRTGDAQILRAQLAAIRRARSHIYIEQPYVSDDEIIHELIAARRRGVDVRVILPTGNDSGLMSSANLLAANLFLRNGVRVYGYPGMSHVKVAIFDGWACVGSANLDKLSLRINQEANLATSDPHFVDRLRRELFDVDFARSREFTEAQPVNWTDYISEFIADQL
ncbi:MAG: phosphatidylserine/phosphatidylglycerophosphate/cardiolipin synthase family protein [Azonexus sp.]